MDTDAHALAAPNAAHLETIRSDIERAAELASCLAVRGTELAAAAGPDQTVLADLAAAARAVAEIARSTSAAIMLLLQAAPDSRPSAQPTATDSDATLSYAGAWAAKLDLQLQTAVKIHALICTELANHAAIAEEWSTERSESQPMPARVLA